MLKKIIKVSIIDVSGAVEKQIANKFEQNF